MKKKICAKEQCFFVGDFFCFFGVFFFVEGIRGEAGFGVFLSGVVFC